MADEIKQRVRYFHQMKATDIETGATVGWQIMCEGHKQMYHAMVCKEDMTPAVVNAMPKSLRASHTIETRIVKVTETMEVVEEAEKVKTK